MAKRLYIFLIVLGAAGCTEVHWRRLAPPGILKYEEIANRKPPNPAIEEKVSEFNTGEAPRFPNLSQTPSEADRPAPRTKQELDTAIAELVEARDRLDAKLDIDRAESEADQQASQNIVSGRDALEEQILKDEAAAKRERKE